MKKLILSAAFVALGVAAFAQKPAAGDMTLETQLSLNMAGPIGFSTPEIRYRYFLNDGMAARVRLGLNMQNNSRDIDNGAPTNKETGSIKTSDFDFNLGVGIEKHLAGTEKLSPYFGAELILGLNGAQQTTAEGSDDGNGFTAKNDKYETSGGGQFSFGLGGVFGADYHFTNSLYVGGEMGWGLGFSSTSEQTAKVTSGGNTNDVSLSNARSGFNLGMQNFPTATLRFGVRF